MMPPSACLRSAIAGQCGRRRRSRRPRQRHRYLYFQTKEEIYLALHLRHEEAFFTALIDQLQRDEPFRFEHILISPAGTISDPTHMALGACCIGLHQTPYRSKRASIFQTKLTGWLLTAGAGLERHLPRLAPGEGVRLLKHGYALMIGLFSLRNERNEPTSSARCCPASAPTSRKHRWRSSATGPTWPVSPTARWRP